MGLSYYVVQRLSCPLFCPGWRRFTFWGWQLVIVWRPSTLPLRGLSSSKGTRNWPIDIPGRHRVWVSAVVFFGTIFKRKVSHIYVANWFFGGLSHRRATRIVTAPRSGLA